MVEADEPPRHPSASCASSAAGPSNHDMTLFGDEPDECSSVASGDSQDYFADVDDVATGTHKSFVKLSFETMTTFLQSQLSTAAKTMQVGEPSQKKKRCYNNTTRAAKAKARKLETDQEKSSLNREQRTARNDPDSGMMIAHQLFPFV